MSTMAQSSSIWDRIFVPEQGDLPADAARYLLSLSFPEQERARYQDLAARDPADLTLAEQGELGSLVDANTVLMLLQAKARVSLKSQQPAA
jgi:hypothetical protein